MPKQRRRRTTERSPTTRTRRLLSRLSIRLLAFNLMLVFLPVVGLLYFEAYEAKLLEAQEGSMVQQARLLVAVLSGQGQLDTAAVRRILRQLEGRTTARIRILDNQGRLVADSSRINPDPVTAAAGKGEGDQDAPETRERWLYRLGAGLFGLHRTVFGSEGSDRSQAEPYGPGQPFQGPEIQEALAGRYGAAWRVSPGQRSITLYSALPISAGTDVVGVVLVSQSTLGVLRDLYDVRLSVFKAILVSIAVALVLSLLVSTTIAHPLRRLRKEALNILDQRGRLTGRFQGSDRRDEIGDLSRALKSMSEQLQRRAQFIESLAQDVSHEFRNPLTAIRTATEVLSEVEEPEQRQKFLAMIEGEVARMEKLLSSLRDITQVDAHLETEVQSTVELDHLLANVVEGFSLRDTKKVQIDLSTPQEPSIVRASPERLVQVFENLLDNAVSFTRDGERVTVEVKRGRDDVLVTVSDRGPGIPAEHLTRIFDRFFTYHPESEPADSRHIGLGLAVVKAIVEGYGGSIEARNRPGGGARFEVRLGRAN